MSTHSPIHKDALRTADFSFIDNQGRKIHLRGVNLSGSSKAPLDQPSHVLKDFWETAERGGESFVGQPLNLDDGSADEHLARLRGWGFNLLRFPVTWEALEHAGPKKYDYEFMDYTIRVLCKCKEYGFRVYLDPHQDTWSRFSGGSGAPFWTLAACGINPYHLSSTHAALLHSEWPLPHNADPASFPAMIWGTNYGRLLSQTLFTLFFAGRAFAPNCIIDNMNIQDYLQSHYIAAFGQLADRIRQADEGQGLDLRDVCIIGWDSLNEPAEGLIEWDDLNKNPTQQGTTLKKGTHPTPAQSLRLGMGHPQTVETWDFGMFGPKRTGTATIDPKGRKIWAEPDLDGSQGGESPDGTHPRWGWKRHVDKWPLGRCIWALHGVWDIESGYILRPDYFKYHPSTGIEVHFMTDFWLPHFTAYNERIRSAHPNSISFIQPPVFALPPAVGEEILKGRCAYTGHYYDGLTLITKHWNWFNADSLGVLRGKYKSPIQAVKIGENAIRKSIMEQISVLKSDAELISAPPPLSSSPSPSPSPPPPPPPPRHPQTHSYPTVIGEIGTPFDMDLKRSYYSPKYKGDYTNQEKALDASLNACDGWNNVNYTIWTYLARGQGHMWGDGWNGEDLSLWSEDDLRMVNEFGDGEDGCSRGRKGGGCVKGGGGAGGALRRRMRSSKDIPKSESQAGLLANRSTGNVLTTSSSSPGDGKNTSTLSLDTISSARMVGDGGEDSPVLFTPSASTPTLLGLGLSGSGSGTGKANGTAQGLARKPSVTFSLKTVDDDESSEPNGFVKEDGVVPVPPLPAPTITTQTTVTTTTTTTLTPSTAQTKDKDKDSSSSSSSTLLDSTTHEADEDPYDFLTNGARAVRAFCRPRPVKVARGGKAVDTRFDIAKAEFRCVVRVNGNERDEVEMREGETEGGEADGEAGEMGVTEIYLPLVHFASDEVLESSKARWDPDLNVRERIQRTGESRVEMETPKMYGLPRGFVPDSDNNDNDDSNDSSEQQRSTTRRRRVLESIEDKLDLLDVEVNVSCGRWKIRGQTLYWSYPRSLSSSSTPTQNRTEGGTGEKEVTIEVKRRGGGIKIRRGGWVEVKSSNKKQQKVRGRGRGERKSWCERLCECDFGCVVM